MDEKNGREYLQGKCFEAKLSISEKYHHHASEEILACPSVPANLAGASFPGGVFSPERNGE